MKDRFSSLKKTLPKKQEGSEHAHPCVNVMVISAIKKGCKVTECDLFFPMWQLSFAW